MLKLFLRLCCCLLLISVVPRQCAAATKPQPQVVLGIERLAEYASLFKNKRVGLITNQTGLDSKLRSSVELLEAHAKVSAIFVPEHGLFGAVKAGELLGNTTYRGIKVYSLYGETKRPTPAMLEGIDLLAIDLQDIGARNYTYASTMAYAMEACAQAGKTFVVFDRPNPMGGTYGGPTLKKGQESFIGLYPLPLRHGLTLGEYARFINTEYHIGVKLEVVPLRNWRRSMYFPATKLPWIMTSPAIPTFTSAVCYLATGITGEANLSVGIGTTKPFEYIGAPWLHNQDFAAKLNALALPGVKFLPVAFTPGFGKYAGEFCAGVQLYVTDLPSFLPVHTGAHIVRLLLTDYPQQVSFATRDTGGYKFDIELGEASLRGQRPLAGIFARWEQENQAFAAQAKPYLLYQ
ncbi:MAG: DUF1343 domain-containing protein [Acidaminococcaceae bacterium]